MPALAALYSPRPASPRSAASDTMLMLRPQPRPAMCGRDAHPRPLAREHERDPTADALTGAGDERDPTGEPVHGRKATPNTSPRARTSDRPRRPPSRRAGTPAQDVSRRQVHDRRYGGLDPTLTADGSRRLAHPRSSTSPRCRHPPQGAVTAHVPELS